jgi:hypothetical protein
MSCRRVLERPSDQRQTHGNDRTTSDEGKVVKCLPSVLSKTNQKELLIQETSTLDENIHAA